MRITAPDVYEPLFFAAAVNATRGDQELEFSRVKQVNVHLLADQAVFQNECLMT